MTVTYSAEVATASFGCFLKLLFRWRGSIYKLMWREFMVFFIAYYSLNMLYRFGLSPERQEVFEIVARYCERHTSLIPIVFVLGFYVSIVVTRWWEQFNVIPWPDSMALFVSANIPGHDERGRLMRRTIMRYLCLSFLIIISCISPIIKKRFPTYKNMQEAGFLQGNELSILEDIQTPHNKYFVPLAWANALITRARKEGRIKDDFAVKTLIDVVTLAVYMFCLSTLMGRQFLREDEGNYDVFIPVFTFLQFFFYMGWLKVAEALINPFGEDDDDFDLNGVIDRNLQVSYLMVDEMHQQHPELIRDQYWDEVAFELPYTAATVQYKQDGGYLGSAVGVEVPKEQQEFVSLSPVPETDSAAVVKEDSHTQNSSSHLHRKVFGLFRRSPSHTSHAHVAASHSRLTHHGHGSLTTFVNMDPDPEEGPEPFHPTAGDVIMEEDEEEEEEKPPHTLESSDLMPGGGGGFRILSADYGIIQGRGQDGPGLLWGKNPYHRDWSLRESGREGGSSWNTMDQYISDFESEASFPLMAADPLEVGSKTSVSARPDVLITSSNPAPSGPPANTLTRLGSLFTNGRKRAMSEGLVPDRKPRKKRIHDLAVSTLSSSKTHVSDTGQEDVSGPPDTSPSGQPGISPSGQEASTVSLDYILLSGTSDTETVL